MSRNIHISIDEEEEEEKNSHKIGVVVVVRIVTEEAPRIIRTL